MYGGKKRVMLLEAVLSYDRSIDLMNVILLMIELINYRVTLNENHTELVPIKQLT